MLYSARVKSHNNNWSTVIVEASSFDDAWERIKTFYKNIYAEAVVARIQEMTQTNEGVRLQRGQEEDESNLSLWWGVGMLRHR